MEKIRIEQPSVLALRYNKNPKISLDDIKHYTSTQLYQFANKLIELATTDKVLDYFKLCCNYKTTMFVSLISSNKQKVIDNVSVGDIPVQLFQYYSANLNLFLHETNSNISVPNDWYKQIIKHISLTTSNVVCFVPSKFSLWHRNQLLLLKYAPEFNPDLYVQIKYLINSNALIKLVKSDIEEYKQTKESLNEEAFTNEQKDILGLYLTPAIYNELVLGFDKASEYGDYMNEEIFDLFN